MNKFRSKINEIFDSVYNYKEFPGSRTLEFYTYMMDLSELKQLSECLGTTTVCLEPVKLDETAENPNNIGIRIRVNCYGVCYDS